MKTKTEVARAAAAIREELKKAFPTVKFSITSKNFSMGNSVSVSWFDGPTCKMVEKISDQYLAGDFDGMTDCYNYTPRTDDRPRAKYIHTTRTVTEEVAKKVEEYLESQYEITTTPYNVRRIESLREEVGTIVYRIVHGQDLTNPITNIRFANKDENDFRYGVVIETAVKGN